MPQQRQGQPRELSTASFPATDLRIFAQERKVFWPLLYLWIDIKPRVQLWILNCSCPSWWHPANVLNQNFSGELISNVEILVYFSEWRSSLAMICVGLSDLDFGVRVRSFNQNVVELRNQSGPRSMTHIYAQVCVGTDLLHSDSENFCSEELAEALHGTLKVRNLVCCSACFLWFTSKHG